MSNHPASADETAQLEARADEEDAKAFGARLRDARVRAGYGSQPAAAGALGVHPMTVHRHEAGAMTPKPAQLRAYAELYGVSEAWLRFGRGEPTSRVPPAVETYLSSKRGKSIHPRVAEALRRLAWPEWTGLSAIAVDEKDVRLVANTLELLLERRGKLRDADTSRAPGAIGAAPAGRRPSHD